MQPSKFNIPGLLRYVEGDATNPRGGGHKLIIHVCNDIGAWGAGFVMALSKRWKKPEQEYRLWHRSDNKFKLGEIQVIDVQSDTAVVNMIAQHDLGLDEEGNPPIRYDALRTCIDKVGELASNLKSSVHGPRFGCGLAGGDWTEIEPMLKELVIQRSVNVTIYDLPQPKPEEKK